MFKYSDSNIMVTISDENLILWFSSDLQYFGDPIFWRPVFWRERLGSINFRNQKVKNLN